MPIDALAALTATGFFENTDRTWPVATSMLERIPCEPWTSITVFERRRKASEPTTTTAWLPRAVETRSPRLTGVPTFASRPLTVALPSSLAMPGGTSPLASASEMIEQMLNAPTAEIHSRLFKSSPLEHDVPYAVAQLQSAPLELGLGPRRRPGRESLRGVLELRRGKEYGKHLVRVFLPVRRHVEDRAGREPRGRERHESR